MHTTPLARRRALSFLLAAAGAMLTFGAAAETPADSRDPPRLLVPFGPGTPLDVIARDIAQELRPILGQNVMVENKPGAAGMIGGAELARTAAPANTFMVTTHNTVVINPHLYRKMAYDPLKDFMPIGLVGVGGYVLVAGPNAPFHNLEQYLAAARAKPGQVSYGSLGVGSGPHMCGEKLIAQTKVKMVHVPYTTGSITNVVGGQVESSWEPYSSAAPFLKTGKLVAIGASTPYRPDIFPPNVPLLPEALKGYECTSWIGMFASARAPEAAVSRMAEALNKVVQSPAFQQRLMVNGFQPRPGLPKDLRELVAADYKSWGKVVREAGIELE
jgi:tripartite-type tricarboxylate transporter receptor subunit TctC